MKKTHFLCSPKALKQFVLALLVSTSGVSAWAQVSSYYTPPAYGNMIDTQMIQNSQMLQNNPSIIFQNQAYLDIYGTNGASLGQLPSGSVFQAQMMRNPFEYVLNQPAFNYPGFLNTAVQTQTPMGNMVPASLEQTAMLADGTTMLPASQFYIPPSEFSYERIRAIGAESNYEDEDINRLLDKVLADDDGDDDHESYTHHSYTSSVSKYQTSQASFYSAPTRDLVNVNADEEEDTSQFSSAAYREVIGDGSPFSVLGPTCDCRAHGRSCVISGQFGVHRAAGRGLKAHMHAGIDIAGNPGTPIIAAADGYVVRVTDTGRRGYGKRIDIKHADNFMTRYADMSRMIVRPGQTIKRGDVIGYMGASGNSTGSHVHFETCKLRAGQDACNSGNVIRPTNFMSNNGSINQDKQFNMSCTDTSARATESAPAAARSSRRNSARSSRARG